MPPQKSSEPAPTYDYDLLVIGSGPAGQRAAIQAAKLNKRLIEFDGQHILISDDILKLERLPRSITIVGAGVIGLEYACIFSTLGVRVTLIDKRTRLLNFVDAEIMDALAYHMRSNRVTLRLGEKVGGMELIEDASGKQITTESALHSIGRTGATDKLGLGGGWDRCG